MFSSSLVIFSCPTLKHQIPLHLAFNQNEIVKCVNVFYFYILMKKTVSKYWLCQIGGWSTYIIVYTFFYLTLRTKEEPYFFEDLFLVAITGLVTTHCMRYFIKKKLILQKSLDAQILYMFLTTVGFSYAFAFIHTYLE